MKQTRFLILILLVATASCKQAEQPVNGVSTTGTQSAEEPKAKPAEVPGTDVGAMMPEYTAMWLDGSKFELSAQKDKVVLLNLWATWCGPCRFEIPELEKMHKEFAARGFEVIGVSVDEGGADTVKQFVTEHQMTYPIVVDPEGKLANVFETSVLPTTVLIDRKGRIVWKQRGAIEANDAALKQAIEKAL